MPLNNTKNNGTRLYRGMKFFHYLPVDVTSLPRSGQDFSLAGNEAQRMQLAQNHGLVAVEHFQANFHLAPRSGRRVFCQADFSAIVVRDCVISGEEIKTDVADSFGLLFVPCPKQAKSENEKDSQLEIVLDVLMEEDVPEFFDGRVIDLGAIVEEFFALSLDPYPRQLDAEFQPVTFNGKESKGEGNHEQVSPFAALRQLV